MAIPGPGIATIALFVGFGLFVGVTFGFFGMGGSFLVTPALLVFDYPATVAVGSGLAFVFGTGVVGALSHRDHGQVDHELAALLVLGVALGLEVGRRVVFALEDLGGADAAIGAAYVGLLGAIGLAVLRNPRTDDRDGGSGSVAPAERVLEVAPLVTLPGGATVSAWCVLAAGLGIGILSGCLGVGGGFLLLPVLTYGFGVPAATAAGTATLQIAISGAFGTFGYALSNAVDVPVVAALLGGSALGARIGASAAQVVDEAAVRRYFAVTLLAGSVAVASEQLGRASGVETLETAGAVLLFGTAVAVAGAVVRPSIAALEAG